jgi:uncharacterized linocin/CFP29 family protein
MDYLLRSQAPLSAKEWQALDSTVIQVARRNLVGRRFLSLFGPLGPGVQSLPQDTFRGNNKGAISLLGDEERDMVTIQSRRYAPVPLLFRDFRVEWRDLETARRLGMPLDTTGAAIAASSVAEIEDRLIFNGYDELGQQGFLNVSGRRMLPLGDWNTVGGGFDAVVNAIRALGEGHFHPPYTLVVPPQLAVLLNRIFGNTAVLEIDQVRAVMGGGVFVTPTLPGNVAVVVAAGQENMDLVLAQDMVTAFLETMAMSHHFRVLESLALRVKQPGAVVVLGQ